MKYAFLVAWREYAESAKAKGFWLSIFLTPAILFLSVQVPVLLEQKATPVRHFVVADQSGAVAPLLGAHLERAHQRQVFEAIQDYARRYVLPAGNSVAPDPDRKGPGPRMNPATAPGTVAFDWADSSDQAVEAFVAKGGKDAWLAQIAPRLRTNAPPFHEPRALLQQVPLPAEINTNASLGALAEALRPYLSGEREIETPTGPATLSAAVLIPREYGSSPPGSGSARMAPGDPAFPPIQFWTTDASEMRLRNYVESAVNGEVRRQAYLARGMDPSLVRQIERISAPVSVLNPKKEKGKEGVGAEDMIRQWAPSGFVYLLWLAIFVIIQMLLSNTIEEKSNRIIEVLLSSVTPGELMMGKLFGIAAVGLTMVGSWVVFLFLILGWKSSDSTQFASQVLTVIRTSNLIPLFAIYFLLGYLLLAAFILALGSLCNTLKEAQSYMGVITMFLILPMLTMTFIPKDPNGTVARVLSWIPIYTPFIMMNRANADPPLVDLIGTMVLLVVSTVGALWMCGKVFRIGILRTGQPPKLLEVLRWVMRRER